MAAAPPRGADASRPAADGAAAPVELNKELGVNDFESNWDEVHDNFDNMALREDLLRGIYAYGFEKPSAIQQRAIMPLIKGKDLIAQAQSVRLSLFCCIACTCCSLTSRVPARPPPSPLAFCSGLISR
jgi:hypothetical protein